jgi:hypothetical protein
MKAYASADMAIVQVAPSRFAARRFPGDPIKWCAPRKFNRRIFPSAFICNLPTLAMQPKGVGHHFS